MAQAYIRLAGWLGFRVRCPLYRCFECGNSQEGFLSQQLCLFRDVRLRFLCCIPFANLQMVPRRLHQHLASGWLPSPVQKMQHQIVDAGLSGPRNLRELPAGVPGNRSAYWVYHRPENQQTFGFSWRQSFCSSNSILAPDVYIKNMIWVNPNKRKLSPLFSPLILTVSLGNSFLEILSMYLSQRLASSYFLKTGTGFIIRQGYNFAEWWLTEVGVARVLFITEAISDWEE